MMLFSSNYGSLCLNCRKPVDDSADSKMFSVQKLLLFQTYSELLRVHQSSRIPSWWDFSEEELPFCQYCLSLVQNLRQLVLEEESIKRKIQRIVLDFKAMMLSGEKNWKYSYEHCRDYIFRELAVTEYRPILQIAKVNRTSDAQRKMEKNEVENKLSQDMFYTKIGNSNDENAVAIASIKNEPVTVKNSEVKIKRKRKHRFTTKKRRKQGESQMEVDRPMKTSNSPTYTTANNGRNFEDCPKLPVNGIDMAQIAVENGHFKCTECHSIPGDFKSLRQHLNDKHPDTQPVEDDKVTMKCDQDTDFCSVILKIEAKNDFLRSGSGSSEIYSKGLRRSRRQIRRAITYHDEYCWG